MVEVWVKYVVELVKKIGFLGHEMGTDSQTWEPRRHGLGLRGEAGLVPDLLPGVRGRRPLRSEETHGHLDA